MTCPKCGSKDIIKNGLEIIGVGGKGKYKCKKCKNRFKNSNIRDTRRKI